MRLYSFFRSSAAYRVRIALNVKGVAYETVSIDLPGSAHRTPEFRAVNPQATIPTLDDDGTILWQSLAIIEYLDARYPSPRLIPAEPVARARVQALAQLIGDDAPLCMRRLSGFLREDRVDEREDHLPLPLVGVSQGVAQEVHSAALPGGLQHLRGGRFKPFVGVGDHQLHAT